MVDRGNQHLSLHPHPLRPGMRVDTTFFLVTLAPNSLPGGHRDDWVCGHNFHPLQEATKFPTRMSMETMWGAEFLCPPNIDDVIHLPPPYRRGLVRLGLVRPIPVPANRSKKHHFEGFLETWELGLSSYLAPSLSLPCQSSARISHQNRKVK
jgi:hypothetical protein